MEPCVDRATDVPVTYPLGQDASEMVVVNRITIPLQIDFAYPATLESPHLLPQGWQHLVRGAAWAEAVRAGEKILLVHRFPHHGDCTLQPLILTGRNANGPRGPSVVLREVDPADGGAT